MWSSKMIPASCKYRRQGFPFQIKEIFWISGFSPLVRDNFAAMAPFTWCHKLRGGTTFSKIAKNGNAFSNMLLLSFLISLILRTKLSSIT